MIFTPENNTSWHLRSGRSADLGMLAFLTLFLAAALQNPLWTWDVVGYVGAALSWRDLDPIALHAQTYSLLRSELAAPVYESLVAGPYASAMAGSAADFQTQLDMYRIKPLYAGLLALSAGIGFSLPSAGILLSAVPATLLCALVYLWLRSCILPHYALAVTILLSVCSRLFDVARVVLPDALSALMVVLAVYLLLERPSARRWGLALLVATILVRTNNILFVVPVLALQTFLAFRKTQLTNVRSLEASGALVASVALYLLLSTWFNHDWWRLFYHTFVGSIVDIGSFAEPFSWELYGSVVWTRLSRLVIGDFTIVTVLLPFLLLSLLALLGSRGQDQRLRAVVLISYLNFLCYFFMFPLVESWDRFFIPFYIFIAVLAARSMASRSDLK